MHSVQYYQHVSAVEECLGLVSRFTHREVDLRLDAVSETLALALMIRQHHGIVAEFSAAISFVLLSSLSFSMDSIMLSFQGATQIYRGHL